MLIDLLILLNKILYCPTDCPINGEGLQVKTLEALIFLERAKGFEPSTHGLGIHELGFYLFLSVPLASIKSRG